MTLRTPGEDGTNAIREDTRTPWRRWVVVSAVVGLTAVLLGVPHVAQLSSVTAQVRATATPTAMADMSMPTQHHPAPAHAPTRYITMIEGNLQMQMIALSGKAATWAEINRVYHMVSTAQAATARYVDVAAARRDGYITAPALFVESQGAHYFNPTYFAEADSGIFDLAHPPFLVYNTVHGKTVFSGLMYYLPEWFTPAQLAAIFPASMAAWHRHLNLCVSGGDSVLNAIRLLPTHDAATCHAQGGSFAHSTGWMVHTWIGQANGAGLFDMDEKTPASKTMSPGMPGM